MSNFLTVSWAIVQSPLFVFLMALAGLVVGGTVAIIRMRRNRVECNCHSLYTDERGDTLHYEDCAVIQYLRHS